jgi:hypothetical protein
VSDRAVGTLSRVAEVEVGFDEPFLDSWHRIVWTFRVAGLALLLVAAVGLLGRGPLSRGTARLADGSLVVRYDRVLRLGAPAQATIEARPRDGGAWRLRLGGDLTTRVRAQDFAPQPTAMAADGQDLVLTFEPTTGQPQASVVFVQQPMGAGLIRGRIDVEGQGRLDIRQIVVP